MASLALGWIGEPVFAASAWRPAEWNCFRSHAAYNRFHGRFYRDHVSAHRARRISAEDLRAGAHRTSCAGDLSADGSLSTGSFIGRYVSWTGPGREQSGSVRATSDFRARFRSTRLPSCACWSISPSKAGTCSLSSGSWLIVLSRLPSLSVREAMIPRTQVVAVPVGRNAGATCDRLSWRPATHDCRCYRNSHRRHSWCCLPEGSRYGSSQTLNAFNLEHAMRPASLYSRISFGRGSPEADSTFANPFSLYGQRAWWHGRNSHAGRSCWKKSSAK